MKCNKIQISASDASKVTTCKTKTRHSKVNAKASGSKAKAKAKNFGLKAMAEAMPRPNFTGCLWLERYFVNYVSLSP